MSTKKFTQTKKSLIAERLQEIQHRHHLRQNILAEQLEITPSYLSQILSGKKTNLSSELILKICSKFNVTSDWLMSDDSEASSPRDEYIHPRISLNMPSEDIPPSNPLEELVKSMTTEELARALNMYGEMALKSNDNMVVKTCAAMVEIFARELRKKI